MSETYRVRVRPKEYKMIKNLSEKDNITFAEATERLIEQNNIIFGEEVINLKNMDEKEIDEVIKSLEDEKEKVKSEENSSSGNGLVLGSIVAGLIYLLSKSAGKD